MLQPSLQSHIASPGPRSLSKIAPWKSFYLSSCRRSLCLSSFHIYQSGDSWIGWPIPNEIDFHLLIGSLGPLTSFFTTKWRLNWVVTDLRPKIWLVTLPQCTHMNDIVWISWANVDESETTYQIIETIWWLCSGSPTFFSLYRWTVVFTSSIIWGKQVSYKTAITSVFMCKPHSYVAIYTYMIAFRCSPVISNMCIDTLCGAQVLH